MRALEFFPLSEVTSVLGQIIRNKLRRILLPAAARAGKGAEQERAARGGQAGDRCGEQTDRVARLYGERPEIFGSASWRTSVELASSVTSDEERRKFDARISAGKRVNGTEIIRASAKIGPRTVRPALFVRDDDVIGRVQMQPTRERQTRRAGCL
jgi:hypothetical protein